MAGDDQSVTWCPSGLADAPESVVLGVRDGASGEVSYLATPIPAREVLGAIPADIDPRRILRFASHCASTCANRRGCECGLVDRVVAASPSPGRDGEAVPRCHLRAHCQWWRQRGAEACHRCPAVVTAIRVDDELGIKVANPETTLAELEAWVARDANPQ